MTGLSHRESARRKAEQLRATETTRARRRRSLTVALTVLVVLAAVVGVGIAVQAQRSTTATAGAAPPAHLTEGGVLVGSPGAPVTVTVYEDFQCPVCRAFESTTGPVLDALRAAGTVKVLDKPVAILDRASSTGYSTRALDAAACVVDAAPAAYPAFASALFAEQPAEGSAGLPDSRLVTLAQQAGAGDLSACIDTRRFAGWAARATDQGSRDGLTGTPYVLVDGKPLASPTPGALRAAVAAARP